MSLMKQSDLFKKNLSERMINNLIYTNGQTQKVIQQSIKKNVRKMQNSFVSNQSPQKNQQGYVSIKPENYNELQFDPFEATFNFK